MCYFFLNFPEYKRKEILIHKANFGHCNNETGNKKNGFWVGPFTKIEDAETNLKKLNGLVKHNFKYRKCSCCKQLNSY